MTTQRKIFIAILVLAASAFGADRLWLNKGDASAQAPQPAPVVVHTAARHGVMPKPVLAHNDVNQHAKRALARRLEDAAAAEGLADDSESIGVPDAFRPSNLWYPAAPAPAPIAAAAPVIGPEKIAEFRSRHRLTAVMKSSGPGDQAAGYAIIGGKVYLPGQVIDGFVLESLGDRSARLSCRGVSFELSVDPPGALTSLSGS